MDTKEEEMYLNPLGSQDDWPGKDVQQVRVVKDRDGNDECEKLEGVLWEEERGKNTLEESIFNILYKGGGVTSTIAQGSR